MIANCCSMDDTPQCGNAPTMANVIQAVVWSLDNGNG